MTYMSKLAETKQGNPNRVSWSLKISHKRKSSSQKCEMYYM